MIRTIPDTGPEALTRFLSRRRPFRINLGHKPSSPCPTTRPGQQNVRTPCPRTAPEVLKPPGQKFPGSRSPDPTAGPRTLLSLEPLNEPDQINAQPRRRNVVEANGIEPMTSCLQSTRSPN